MKLKEEASIVIDDTRGISRRFPLQFAFEGTKFTIVDPNQVAMDSISIQALCPEMGRS